MSQFGIMRSRYCNLSKIQMQYANTINKIVADVKFVPRKMTKILDHLYLGDFEDATDLKELEKHGITHILNTVHDYYENCKTGAEFYGDQYKYHGFTSDDDERYPIMNHFKESYDFIESARSTNGKCLIHCMAGINRSGCLATAYYMLHKNTGPISAAQHIFDSRGMLLSNSGFIERLVNFAVEQGLLELDQNKIIRKYVM